MIVDMPTSARRSRCMELSKEYEKIMIVTDAGSSDITGKSCSPYTAHWTYDTYPTPTPSAAPSSSTAATPGSSSPPITLFGHSSSATPARW